MADDIGKYFLIDVPDYQGGPEGAAGQRLGTYVRLGSVDPGVAGKAAHHPVGEDLAHLGGQTVKLPAAPKRTGANPPDHARGGRRDHTDGNHISTTRGDRIDVISGQYRRVITAPSPAGASAASASLVSGSSSAFASDSTTNSPVHVPDVTPDDHVITPLEDTSDIVKHLYADVFYFDEANNRLYREEVFRGYSYDYYLGDYKYEQNGEEDASGVKPEIVERTWAKSIDSRQEVYGAISEVVLASAIASTVNTTTLTEAVTAVNIAEMVNATAYEEQENVIAAKIENLNYGTLTRVVNVPGPVQEMINAGVYNEQINAALLNENMNVAGLMTEMINAGSRVESVSSPGPITEMTTTPAVFSDIKMAGMIAELALAPGKLDLFVGGAYADVKVAGFLAEIVLAPKLEFIMPLVLELVLGAKLEWALYHKDFSEEHEESSEKHVTFSSEVSFSSGKISLGMAQAADTPAPSSANPDIIQR